MFSTETLILPDDIFYLFFSSMSKIFQTGFADKLTFILTL